LKRERKKLNL